MEQYDPRIDAFIKKSADFAKPILKHIRQLVHSVSPDITENIKWGMPFFEYKGTLCNMAAFKQHCAFGFWKAKLLNDPDHVLNAGEETAMGGFGRITSLADLPSDNVIADFIRQAVALNEKDIKVARAKPTDTEKKALVVPDYFTATLNGHPKAKETFDKFSYSNKKEYVDWMIEAKTDATRQKRLETAVEWLSEGKSRMWKYKK